MDKLKIGITHGDINGISYEVMLKTLEDNRILECCTPIIYGSAMFRSVMCKSVLQDTFQGISSDIVDVYREEMGIDITVFDHLLSVTDEWIILLVCGIMCLIIGALMLRYSKKSDR